MKLIRSSVPHSTSRKLLLSKASKKTYVQRKRVKIPKNVRLNKEKDNTVEEETKNIKEISGQNS
jgi:hypothetical protein